MDCGFPYRDKKLCRQGGSEVFLVKNEAGKRSNRSINAPYIVQKLGYPGAMLGCMCWEMILYVNAQVQ